ncbi:nickel transporter [Pseudoduganella sp. DS3]|uniref:Nickel/cobalt efflux system n=1 Tax=Pseudoduganella guangdongensis TaxID=2692179 RepID=A0A6N9HL53_9BURK|nr:nickel transporter [Pseudoduganella guangdongensis]MYN04069.1 nickel transporter [Pseudoduganella guangdongensis]
MPDTNPDNLMALCLLVYLLGMKHGFDADHLAAIDGLSRSQAPSNWRLARWCGVWFSLGHGAVVVAIALAASMLAARWRVPPWLELCGAWISVGFLLALGLVNLRAALSAAARQVVYPVGIKGRLLGRFLYAAHPARVALVGALFAISFDTISQATLFAMSANRHGGWQCALLFGVLFMLGMVVTDAINGFWFARLARRADQAALQASRIMSVAVAMVSLLVAGFGLLKILLPDLRAWSEGKGLFFGTVVVVVVYGAFLLAIAGARVRPPAPADSPM